MNMFNRQVKNNINVVLQSVRVEGGYYEKEYIVVLEDAGNQALGELEFGASDEEMADAIKGAMVIEAYQLTVTEQ